MFKGEMMENTIKKLKKEFDRIAKKGYIRGIYNNSASIGRTFENELKLPRNTMEIPDYEGVEIKTRRTYSKSYITLFTAIPDGDRPQEIERLKNAYGYPYKKDKRYKTLYANIYGNIKTFGGVKYQYKLDVDRKNKKIYLCVYDRFNNLIEREVYWSFMYLESKIMLKLQILAVVNAWPKQIDGWNYFRYHRIEFYLFKDFEVFLRLIEDGVIRITFKVDIHKDEEHYGQTYDHGCSFDIQEKDIVKLYDRYTV